VLLALLERPGEVVSRHELRRRIWPEESFGDFDHAVSVAVAKLRTALGDSPEIPRFVETLHRRGYRFVFPISVATEPEAVNAGRPTLGQVPQTETTGNLHAVGSRRSRYVVPALCFGLLVAIVATYHFWPHPKSPNVLAKITRISDWNKPMGGARLSPDGHSVVFAAPVAGIPQLFVMLTSGGEPLQVTNDAGNKLPNNFSPDGTQIYYQREYDGDEVWTVPTLGGSPHRVVSGYDTVPSSDGAFIFYRKFDNPGIFRADKSGLNEEMIYKAEGTSLFPLLAFPRGNDLLVGGLKEHAIDFVLFRIDLTRHQAVDLGEVAYGYPDVAWAEPGNSLLLSRTVNGLTNIWKYDLRNRGFTQTTFGPGVDYYPMPDPGGKGIYFVNAKFSGVLAAYHVHSKQSSEIVSDDATQPIISPDGKRVMYITNSAVDRTEVWVSDIDGSRKLKIATGENLATGTWAPDDTRLSYFEMGSSAEAKAYIVQADANGLRQVPAIGHTLILNPVWSPNQKSVYLSTIENWEASPKIWKWSLDSSRPQELVDKCGIVYDVDPGEQYLLGAWAEGEGSGIYEVSISDRKCVSLIPGVKTDRPMFARDGKSILYELVSRGETSIFRQSWKDGKLIGTPQVALKVPFSFRLSFDEYDFSRDLSTIVYARPSGNADLYLLSQK
jgi:Tol biopolymer transport system component/DNA-binding winged helix-turn-helix (wHTH) protein